MLGTPEAPQLQGFCADGARGTRTPDLLGAIQALSQLSYSPARVPRRCCGLRSVVAERVAPSAVSFERGMGLLDEAIREHLELKRRSGADPSVVEREEEEALAPAPPEDALAGLEGQEGELEYEDEAYAEDLPIAAADGELPPAEEEHRIAPSLSDLAAAGLQDTAELDMQAAMDAEVAPAAGAPPYAAPGGGSWAKPYAGRQPERESPEWELPGDRDREPPSQNIPGQERLSFE
jgi:hypothetical protein